MSKATNANIIKIEKFVFGALSADFSVSFAIPLVTDDLMPENSDTSSGLNSALSLNDILYRGASKLYLTVARERIRHRQFIHRREFRRSTYRFRRFLRESHYFRNFQHKFTCFRCYT